MLRLNYLVAACVLALTVGTANANTVTFDASGTFAPNSFYPTNPPNLSGSLTVANGLITAVDLKVTDFPDFIFLLTSSSSSQP